MKNRIKKVFMVLLVSIILTASLTTTTLAISLNYSGGSSSNDTGAKATTSGFVISYEEAYKNICGYRFSVVTSAGTPKSGTKTVNVYLSDKTDGVNAYDSAQRFIVSSGKIANKKQLANSTKVSGTTTTQSCDYKSGNCGFYSTLPQNPTSIGTWIKNTSNTYQNLSRIYVLCGTKLADASESDYVITEPIFRVKLSGKVTAATATELALYGASVSGGDGYNGTNGNLYNAGSGTLWNLCNYINREFPNSLYVSSKTDVYDAVTISTSSRYTYKTIITKGYGCSVLTVKNVVPIKKVYIAYHPNGGTTTTKLNDYGFIIYNNATYFQVLNHGQSSDPYNATTFGMTRKGYQFAGWKVKSTEKILDQDTKYASTEYAQYNDKTKTTANTTTVYCYLYAQWTPNKVEVAYHPNGGTPTTKINEYGYILYNDKAYFQTINYGSTADPYNATTFGLTRDGYTFKGWKVNSTGVVLDQDTKYDSTVYAQHDDKSKTTANTATVKCHLFAVWELYAKIVIVPIEPNAPYRENTDVVTSFWLVNISGSDYTPSTGAKVKFIVQDDLGKVIAEDTQDVVAPNNDKNLTFVRWHVPDSFAGKSIAVKAYIIDGIYQYGQVQNDYKIASFDLCKTPNTSYNEKAPDGFTVPSTTYDNNTNARWWQWEYINNAYVKKEYAVKNVVDNVIINTPSNPSAKITDGILFMKSGYGFECSYSCQMINHSDYEQDSVTKCFAPQFFYALFPEYNYDYGVSKCRSFETVSGKKEFVIASGMARQHFTPIYFPDGDYNFQIVLSDCWTPAGMLTTYKTVTIKIDGNMYDDHYIGRR